MKYLSTSTISTTENYIEGLKSIRNNKRLVYNMYVLLFQMKEFLFSNSCEKLKRFPNAGTRFKF